MIALVKHSSIFPRVCSPEQTIALCFSKKSLIPITRVTNLTPLDRIGIPVWSCATPKALDLTTHLGKGLSHPAAKASALMEAIERATAERHVGEFYITADDAINAGLCDLGMYSSMFSPNYSISTHLSCSWSQGKELVSDQDVYLPSDFVRSPPQDGLLQQVDTNGLASGNSLNEALLHALSEVIERDVASQHSFVECYLPDKQPSLHKLRINCDTLPGIVGDLIEKIRSANLYLVVEFLLNDMDLPVFEAMLIDFDYPSRDGVNPRCFVGYGLAPNAELSAIRAITEAAQSRLAVIQGARDTINKFPSSNQIQAWCRAITAQPLHSFAFLPSYDNKTISADCELLIHCLKKINISRILMFDITDEKIGIPVVRIRVPELSRFVVDRRDLNWRCLRYAL
jgi:ribosomal protein S12 methylthiotransferase accessory factor